MLALSPRAISFPVTIKFPGACRNAHERDAGRRHCRCFSEKEVNSINADKYLSGHRVSDSVIEENVNQPVNGKAHGRNWLPAEPNEMKGVAEIMKEYPASRRSEWMLREAHAGNTIRTPRAQAESENIVARRAAADRASAFLDAPAS